MPIINIAPQNKSTDAIEQGISEVNQTLSEMKEKTGQANDTGGSTTNGSIFAKLNALLYQFTETWTNARASKLDLLDNSTYGLSKIQGSIGTTSNTGGSASAGTLMAKSNRIITTLDSINSVNKRYTPISTLQKTLLNTEISHDTTSSKLIAKFMPDKDGAIRVRVQLKVNITKSGGYGMFEVGALYSNTFNNGNVNTYPQIQTPRDYNNLTEIRTYENQNTIDYSLPIGTVLQGGGYNYKYMYKMTNTAYKTDEFTVQAIKGIPIMLYMDTLFGTVYCNLVQLLYEEV